jgi:hypothetical protein
MFFRWNKGFITFPIIPAIKGYGNIFYFFPKLESFVCGTIAADKGDTPLSKSVNGNPDPTVVFLNPHTRMHLIEFPKFNIYACRMQV